MSVKSILKDIRLAANSKQARDLQYKNYAFTLTFNRNTTIDLLKDVITSDLNNAGYNLTTNDFRELEIAAGYAFKQGYSKANLIASHSKNGYELFGEPQHTDQDLAVYTGYKATGTGKKLPKGGPVKLAVLFKQNIANAGGPQVTYARSLQTAYGGEHNAVIRELWINCVRICLRKFKELTKNPKHRDPTANRATTVGAPSGTSKNLRLHGPTATKHGPNAYKRGDAPGMPQAGSGHNDTSVPVVSIVEALQQINAGTIKVPAEIKSLQAYNKAYQDILAALDLEFEIDGDTLSSAVLLHKDIIISLSTGGDMHQYLMEHADLTSVNAILNKIENTLVRKLSQNTDYVRSEKITEQYIEKAAGHIGKEFLTKAGNLDMRFKANKQKVLNGLKTKKEKSKAKHNKYKAGRTIATGAQAGKYTKKRGRPSKMDQAQGGNALALKELLNAVLPDIMLKNMGSPALNNRTGRFRNSAEVVNVVTGPRGGTNIDYTYMKNPYQTFEPGGAMGSTHRDPRRLIGASIREAAQKIMGNRFVKVRSV